MSDAALAAGTLVSSRVVFLALGSTGGGRMQIGAAFCSPAGDLCPYMTLNNSGLNPQDRFNGARRPLEVKMMVALVFAACLVIYAICFWLTFGELERGEAQLTFKRTIHTQQAR